MSKDKRNRKEKLKQTVMSKRFSNELEPTVEQKEIPPTPNPTPISQAGFLLLRLVR